MKGMPNTILCLPDHIMILIFQYFNFQEKLQFMRICKTFKEKLSSSYLWKEIVINNNMNVFLTNSERMNFRKILLKSS